MSRPADDRAADEAGGGPSWRGRSERACPRELEAQAAEARLQHLGWLLDRGHGYLVRGLGDEPLGRVAALSYGADDRWPRALTLRPRGLRGLWSRATCELPFSAVLAVAPTRREVRVMSEGWPPGGPSPEGFSVAAVRRPGAPGPRSSSRSRSRARAPAAPDR
jgi:hypothetical protein